VAEALTAVHHSHHPADQISFSNPFARLFAQNSDHLLHIFIRDGRVVQMVNCPKTRKTFCASKKCKKHTLHKVTQYKAGKASLYAQGRRFNLSVSSDLILLSCVTTLAFEAGHFERVVLLQ
jgi:hypothetical protein